MNKPLTPRCIAIAGGSGSGKSWLATRLVSALGPRAACVALDDFYRDRSHLSPVRRARINFDHPRAIDWEALRHCVDAFRSGLALEYPSYDFTTHSRCGSRRIAAGPPILVVEGLWLLTDRQTRDLIDFGIYIECPARVRLARRLARDVAERGRTAESVRRQFRETVAPMHALHVAPQARHADFIVRGDWSIEAQRLAAALARQCSDWGVCAPWEEPGLEAALKKSFIKIP